LDTPFPSAKILFKIECNVTCNWCAALIPRVVHKTIHNMKKVLKRRMRSRDEILLNMVSSREHENGSHLDLSKETVGGFDSKQR
jgi:predicted DCC family thiol-disulfide oxidoreductase YuxK